MIGNPVLRRELQTALRGGRIFMLTALYALVLGGLAVQAWPERSQALFGSRLGEQIFRQYQWLQLALAFLLTPALTWSAISAEREQGTWVTLRASPLRNYQIVLGKLVAAVVLLFLFVGASLPVTSYVFFLGGVAPAEVRRVYVLSVLASLAAGSAGLAASAMMRKTYLAIPMTYVLVGLSAAAFALLRSPLPLIAACLLYVTVALVFSRRVLDREGSEEASRPRESDLELTGNRVAERDLASSPRARQAFARAVFWIGVLIPIGLVAAIYYTGYPGARVWFPGYLAVSSLIVMLTGLAAGAYGIASEKEAGTLPLLLSTPLPVSEILQGKLRFALWHVALIVSMMFPGLVFCAAFQLMSFADVIVMEASYLAWGFGAAVLGLFCSLRARRTNRALGVGLALLILLNSASLQVIPLARERVESRWGQVLMATSTVHTLWHRYEAPPWERIKGAGYAEAAARPFATLDDLPYISVLAGSMGMSLGGSGLLWIMMRRRFFYWAAN